MHATLYLGSIILSIVVKSEHDVSLEIPRDEIHKALIDFYG